jgi:hypothetical protein
MPLLQPFPGVRGLAQRLVRDRFALAVCKFAAKEDETPLAFSMSRMFPISSRPAHRPTTRIDRSRIRTS